MANIAVIIGRFSLVHKGHEALITHAIDNYDRVIVLIGSSYQARTPKNPFTGIERRRILRKMFRYAEDDIDFSLIRDYPYSDTKWGVDVCSQVQMVCEPEDKITIVGCDRDSSTYYLKSFPQWNLDLIDPVGDNLSATNYRKALFEQDTVVDFSEFADLPEEMVEFLQEYVKTEDYANTKAEYRFIEDYKKKISVFPYPVTINTADAVIIQSNHVLVVERLQYPGKGCLALPGGHIELNETLMEAAIREAYEETGIMIATGKKAEQITKDILRMSVKASRTFDYPERSLKARVITEAFLISLDDTKALPALIPQQNEVKRTFWMPIGEALAKTNWLEDHWHILNWAVSQRN